jgi:hypothetical protein
MYARLVRFEGAEPTVLETQLEEMRQQIQSGMSGETQSDTTGQLDQDQMESLRKLIKGVLVMADRDKGSSAMVAFTETEDEMRQLDEMFNQMSPGEGGGKRQSVDIYEVAIDQHPEH